MAPAAMLCYDVVIKPAYQGIIIVIRKVIAAFGAAVALGLIASPVAAQINSDSYKFLEAVKKRDGTTVTDLVSVPGSVVINTTGGEYDDGALNTVVRRSDYAWLSFLLGKDADANIRNGEGGNHLALTAQLGLVAGARLLPGDRSQYESLRWE